MRYKTINHNRNRLSGCIKASLTGLFGLLLLIQVKAQDYWRPDIVAFDNYMTITGYIMFSGEELQSDQIEVGCFIDGECRGNYRLQAIEYMGHPYTCFLPVWGDASDNGKAITVLMYNHATDRVYEAGQKPEYEYNGDLGTGDPYELTINQTEPVGREAVEAAISLKAWIRNGTLHISGLTIGKSWSVYNLAGVLLYRDIAKNEVETQYIASLQFCGVYIVQSGDRAVKVVTRDK